jgi:hypothetical protein
VTLPEVRLVVPDGSGVLAVGSVSWYWNEGDDVKIPLRVIHQGGAPYALSGTTVGTLAFWESETDGFPKLQIDFTVDGDGTAGLAHFTIARGALPANIYSVGARFVDSVTTKRDTVLLPGRVEVWKSTLP